MLRPRTNSLLDEYLSDSGRMAETRLILLFPLAASVNWEVAFGCGIKMPWWSLGLLQVFLSVYGIFIDGTENT